MLAFHSKVLYTKQVINQAPWSSGQDATLSRSNQEFDSPRGHYAKNSSNYCSFFVLFDESCLLAFSTSMRYNEMHQNVEF